jgi:hypothetical protein
MTQESQGFVVRRSAGSPSMFVPDSRATKGFGVEDPMNPSMDTFPQLPWEKPVADIALSPSKPITPWGARAVFVSASAQKVVAAEYVERAARELPEDLRKRLLRGVGMFDVPVGTPDHDDPYE